MKEVWKEIEGFNGDYFISNLGNIKSFKKGDGVILKKRVHSGGYLRSNLSLDGKIYDKYNHRLVAKHFIKNPNNFKEVNHMDGDKTNNIVTNLEWCSNRYNIDHSIKNGLKKDYGVDSPNAKLNIIQLNEIRELFKNTSMSFNEIGRIYEVSGTTVSNIYYGKRYAKN